MADSCNKQWGQSSSGLSRKLRRRRWLKNLSLSLIHSIGPYFGLKHSQRGFARQIKSHRSMSAFDSKEFAWTRVKFRLKFRRPRNVCSPPHNCRVLALSMLFSVSNFFFFFIGDKICFPFFIFCTINRTSFRILYFVKRIFLLIL